MVKTNVTSNTNGTQRNYSTSYEYDKDGRVTKVSSTYDNSSTKYEYQNGRLFKITKTDAVGNSTSPFIEFNSKGLLTKYIEYYSGFADEFRYEYDQEDNVIRQERWINGQASSASVREYDDKKYAFGTENLKGSPNIPETYPYSTKHNFVKVTAYEADGSGKWEPAGSSVYSLTYNGHNYPIEEITKSYDSKGVEISSSKSLYSYQGCN